MSLCDLEGVQSHITYGAGGSKVWPNGCFKCYGERSCHGLGSNCIHGKNKKQLAMDDRAPQNPNLKSSVHVHV